MFTAPSVDCSSPRPNGSSQRIPDSDDSIPPTRTSSTTRVEPGCTTPGNGRIERASSRPRRPAAITNATTVPTSIRREPSVIAVQWKASWRPGPYSTMPRPRASLNSVTSPSSGLPPIGRRSCSPVQMVGIDEAPSVHDLRQGQFDDVHGATILECRDQHVDLGLRHHRLHGESPPAEQFRDGR